MRLSEMIKTVNEKIAAGEKSIEIITSPGLGVNAQLEETFGLKDAYYIDSVIDSANDFTIAESRGKLNLISINAKIMVAETIVITDCEGDEVLEEVCETLMNDHSILDLELENLKTVIKVTYDFALSVDEIIVI